MGPKLKTELRKFQTFVCSQFVGAFAVIGPVAPVIAICGILLRPHEIDPPKVRSVVDAIAAGSECAARSDHF